jgi:hypothetical protein
MPFIRASFNPCATSAVVSGVVPPPNVLFTSPSVWLIWAEVQPARTTARIQWIFRIISTSWWQPKLYEALPKSYRILWVAADKPRKRKLFRFIVLGAITWNYTYNRNLRRVHRASHKRVRSNLRWCRMNNSTQAGRSPWVFRHSGIVAGSIS